MTLSFYFENLGEDPVEMCLFNRSAGYADGFVPLDGVAKQSQTLLYKYQRTKDAEGEDMVADPITWGV